MWIKLSVTNFFYCVDVSPAVVNFTLHQSCWLCCLAYRIPSDRSSLSSFQRYWTVNSCKEAILLTIFILHPQIEQVIRASLALVPSLHYCSSWGFSIQSFLCFVNFLLVVSFGNVVFSLLYHLFHINACLFGSLFQFQDLKLNVNFVLSKECTVYFVSLFVLVISFCNFLSHFRFNIFRYYTMFWAKEMTETFVFFNTIWVWDAFARFVKTLIYTW